MNSGMIPLMKLPAAPLVGISASLRPRLSGFSFYSNKLQDIQAKANKIQEGKASFASFDRVKERLRGKVK